MHDRRTALVMGVGGLLVFFPSAASALERNTFTQGPDIRPAAVKWKLLQDFAFKDGKGKVWRVKAPYLTDGASIPRVLWPLTGHPMQTNYFKAALIHDAYCDSMKASWENTHGVFYDAMRAQGLSESEAKTKYFAVYNFGPRWDGLYRWTSLFELDKRRRPDRPLKPPKSWSGPPPPPLPPPPPEWYSAERIAEEKFLAYQQAEMSRAEALIVQRNLSLAETAELGTSATFDYQAEQKAAYEALQGL